MMMKVFGLLILSLLALQSDAVSRDSFLSYGSAAGDSLLPKSSEAVSSIMLPLDEQYNFYNAMYDSVYVSGSVHNIYSYLRT